MDSQVCITFGVVDPPFTYRMVDNMKFITNLKFGAVNHLIDKKRVANTKIIKNRVNTKFNTNLTVQVVLFKI